MTTQLSVPFDCCYWVVPGKLMAGCYPGGPIAVEAEHRLSGLLAHGVRHVVNLMETHELDFYGNAFVPYEPVMQALADAAGLSVAFARFPIRDMDIPDEAGMIGILDHIDEQINNNIPLYVHCLGGIGRTGTVVGCYLARHGVANGRKALAMIKALRKSTANKHQRSPQTELQEKMVKNWKTGM
ncbi:MAG: protein-tyrosine phosphatase family protein [Thermodesulfobacteriota bacterium]|nr:protein-tyrosine phosphatase family protein [Thermodesulfobacteriota bacterium]